MNRKYTSVIQKFKQKITTKALAYNHIYVFKLKNLESTSLKYKYTSVLKYKADEKL